MDMKKRLIRKKIMFWGYWTNVVEDYLYGKDDGSTQEKEVKNQYLFGLLHRNKKRYSDAIKEWDNYRKSN